MVNSLLASYFDRHQCVAEFPTTRMEMAAVADIFDRNGDGYIDYKEFISALKPDREVILFYVNYGSIA